MQIINNRTWINASAENSVSHMQVEANRRSVDNAIFDNSGYTDLMKIQNLPHEFLLNLIRRLISSFLIY